MSSAKRSIKKLSSVSHLKACIVSKGHQFTKKEGPFNIKIYWQIKMRLIIILLLFAKASCLPVTELEDPFDDLNYHDVLGGDEIFDGDYDDQSQAFGVNGTVINQPANFTNGTEEILATGNITVCFTCQYNITANETSSITKATSVKSELEAREIASIINAGGQQVSNALQQGAIGYSQYQNQKTERDRIKNERRQEADVSDGGVRSAVPKSDTPKLKNSDLIKQKPPPSDNPKEKYSKRLYHRVLNKKNNKLSLIHI